MYRRLLISIAVLAALLLPATAQAGDVVFVLDGSLSMATKLDPTAKPANAKASVPTRMSLAKTVIDGLLPGMPADAHVGLTAYGSTDKKSCTDVRTMVAVDALDKDALDAELGHVTPTGKAPMSMALTSAFAQLPNGGHVILLTDGLDTCQPETPPCDLANLLRTKSPNVNLDVVGIGVGKDDVAGLTCVAKNAGGRYVGMPDAKNLSNILAFLNAPPKQADTKTAVAVTLKATDGTNDVPGTTFTVYAGSDPTPVLSAGPGLVQLPRGLYRVTATASGLSGSDQLSVADTPKSETITPGGPTIKATLQLSATTLPAASMLSVVWSGPAQNGDYLSIEPADGLPRPASVTSTLGDDKTVSLRAPSVAGDYNVNYRRGTTDEIIGTASFTVTPSNTSVSAPPTVAAGSTVSVAWVGPAVSGDWVAFYRPGVADDSFIASAAVTVTTSPTTLTAPLLPGNYEVRYVGALDRASLARQAVTVTAVSAAVSGPLTAPAAGVVPVTWRGPAGSDDFISIMPHDAAEDSKQDGTWWYATGESPLELRAPAVPGTYDIRYVQVGGSAMRIIATARMQVTAPEVTLYVPATAPAGSTIALNYRGPDLKGDTITIGRPGLPDNDTSYGQVPVSNDGSNQVSLTLPSDPGTYEIRYLAAVGPAVIARAQITIN